MPIYLSSSGYGYTYKKEKRKSKFNRRGLLKVFFVILILLILCGTYFLVKTFCLKKDNVTNVYAVATKANSGNEQEIASEIKLQGGAGFVCNKDENCYVFFSCYKTLLDAQKITDALNENGYQVEIITMCMSANMNNLSIKNKNFGKYFNLFYENYCKLYDLSIEFDKNNINMENLNDSIEQLLIYDNNFINEFNSQLNSSANSIAIYLKIYLNNLVEQLQNLKTKTTNVSSEIKFAYFNVIDIFQQLLQNI